MNYCVAATKSIVKWVNFMKVEGSDLVRPLPIRVYNTLSRRKEDFLPLRPAEVSMYVCGVTVYDECHLGHARAYVCFDVVRRFFRYAGYHVTYVQNFTDVDDKIIARARENAPQDGDMNQLSRELAERYIDRYFQVMNALGIESASVYPRATEHIGDMIELIAKLIEKGSAYAVDGDVFFSVASFDNYGQLSGKAIEDLRSGERVEVDVRKRSPLDFALWKSVKPGEPAWDSPWGAGRPGWHIECSAMSLKHFKGTFDIHGGGCDLIFPHHENEIAQSEAATGETFARYWMHNGFLTINQEKMSKSLGNFFTLKDIFEQFSPETVRLFLLAAHYRSPIDFSDERLKEAEEQLHRGYMMLRNAQVALFGWDVSESRAVDWPELKAIQDKFIAGMCDDFNTAIAIACLFEIIHAVNVLLAQKKRSEEDLMRIKAALALFADIASVLHLFQSPFTIVTLTSSCQHNEEAEAQRLLQARAQARADKNWSLADELRDQILAMFKDVELTDTVSGPIISFRALA